MAHTALIYKYNINIKLHHLIKESYSIYSNRLSVKSIKIFSASDSQLHTKTSASSVSFKILNINLHLLELHIVSVISFSLLTYGSNPKNISSISLELADIKQYLTELSTKQPTKKVSEVGSSEL